MVLLNADVDENLLTSSNVKKLRSTLLICTYPANVNGKVFPYSLPSVGPGADPGVQAVIPQVT